VAYKSQKSTRGCKELALLGKAGMVPNCLCIVLKATALGRIVCFDLSHTVPKFDFGSTPRHSQLPELHSEIVC
jgi:hypothetical protein